jgi:hypothetical protein
MPRRSWLPSAILLAAGIAILLGGLAAVAMGLVNPTLLRQQLPPEAEVDAPAVGGAAVALGVATALVGLLHLVTAAALRRGVSIAATAAVVLAATMAVIALGFAVAALVSIASGAALPIYMVPASVVMGAAVIGYAIVTVILIGSRTERI